MFDTQTRAALKTLGLSDDEIDVLESAQKSFIGKNVKVKAKEYSADEWKKIVISLWKLLQACYPYLEGNLKKSVGHVLDQLSERFGGNGAETVVISDTKWFDPEKMLSQGKEKASAGDGKWFDPGRMLKHEVQR